MGPGKLHLQVKRFVFAVVTDPIDGRATDEAVDVFPFGDGCLRLIPGLRLAGLVTLLKPVLHVLLMGCQPTLLLEIVGISTETVPRTNGITDLNTVIETPVGQIPVLLFYMHPRFTTRTCAPQMGFAHHRRVIASLSQVTHMTYPMFIRADRVVPDTVFARQLP